MNIKTLAKKAVSPLSKQRLVVQKHSPVLLFGMGMVGVTATVVLACRATLKLSEEFDKAEDAIKDVDTARTNDEEEEMKQKNFGVRLQLAIKIARMYAPAAAVGVLSVGALTGSHVILSRRNAGLAAAYGIVDNTFKRYRAEVIKDQGIEKDREYLHPIREREIVDETETGPVVSTVTETDIELAKKLEPVSYDRVFDKSNSNWKPYGTNWEFLQGVQNYLNDELRLDGFVFLNRAYELLGFPKTMAGQQVGWVKGADQKFDEFGIPQGDGYISIGLGNDPFQRDMFPNGRPSEIVLTFNVDGDILSSLDRV